MARVRFPDHSPESYLYERGELEDLFAQLVQQWRDDTMPSSQIREMVMHPSYQRIIGIGRQAVPLILAELGERPDYWFWALRSITGEDPSKPGASFQEGVAAWLNWGKERGYITDAR